jgi:hypothetical protein
MKTTRGFFADWGMISSVSDGRNVAKANRPYAVPTGFDRTVNREEDAAKYEIPAGG